jgi:hypothetical protein
MVDRYALVTSPAVVWQRPDCQRDCQFHQTHAAGGPEEGVGHSFPLGVGPNLQPDPTRTIVAAADQDSFRQRRPCLALPSAPSGSGRPAIHLALLTKASRP